MSPLDICRWIENYYVTRDTQLDSIPALLRPIVGAWFIYPNVSRFAYREYHDYSSSRQVHRTCQARDMLGWSRETRTRGIQAYLDATNTYLSDKLLTGGDDAEPVYIFDKGKPTLVDATVFGFLVCMLIHPT